MTLPVSNGCLISNSTLYLYKFVIHNYDRMQYATCHWRKRWTWGVEPLIMVELVTLLVGLTRVDWPERWTLSLTELCDESKLRRKTQGRLITSRKFDFGWAFCCHCSVLSAQSAGNSLIQKYALTWAERSARTNTQICVLGCGERWWKYTNTCIGLWRAFTRIHKYVYWAVERAFLNTRICVLGAKGLSIYLYTNSLIFSNPYS